MSHESVLREFVGAFVSELAGSGVRHACVCPGSRSTPLAMVMESHPDITLWMHLDERSAAYFALGLARATRSPVALLCTSGTAAANFFPAIVEADEARVPLLVLTADRPPELRGIGANQAIDQIHLYGRHVRWFLDVGLPDDTSGALRYIATVACRSVAVSRSEPRGPVHLNFPFREPLVPALSVERGLPALGPSIRVHSGLRAVDPFILDELAAVLAGAENGLIVCGPQDDPAFPSAVTRLARAYGYPLLADPLSNIRTGPHDRGMVVDAYDAMLRDAPTAATLGPQVVLRFGAAPTSKALLQFLERNAEAHQIVVDGGAGWIDPILQASEMVHADATLLCTSLVDQKMEQQHRETAWTRQWLSANRLVRSTLLRKVSSIVEPFEGAVPLMLADVLPEGAMLFAGNSMPVRDLDSFFPSVQTSIRFLANRGASGIDGVVSTALGAAAGSTNPVFLVVGDLSFYHDLNGLLAAKLFDIDLTIILVNNDGGGIFSFLPQANYSGPFETLFGTPHGLDFQGAVAMYGGAWEHVEDVHDLARKLRSTPHRGLRVFEMVTDRERNVALHRSVWQAVSAALAQGARLQETR